ncbi:MAG TPA: NAD(P)-binding oxidoreductase [Gaiellaceae bacterium]|nr:NAD(P)-binding oxidoreductase [Gaiellaceae bacterium]
MASHHGRNERDRSGPLSVAVLGAAGATGIPLVEQALAAGDRVTALVHSRQKLPITNPNLHVVEGDATDPRAVSEAMRGADAVISVLGARGPVMADATQAIVDIAKQVGPERVVMLSSFAVARDRLTPVAKAVTGMAMGSQIKDKAAGEDVLRASGLDWTIVYATKLTNGHETGRRVVPESEKVGLSDKISRADVAAFLLQSATDDLGSQGSVVITGSEGNGPS